MEARIIERTLYPPIVEHLRRIGFDSIGESGISSGFSDVVFSLGEHRFVLEVKIGKFSPALSTKAIAQALSYARDYDTHDILVITYPESLRNKAIPNSQWLSNVALNETVQCHIFTEYWEESLEGKPIEIFNELKNRIETKNRKIDLQSVVKQIQTIVADLNVITQYVKKEDLVSEVVSKLDLFTAIGEIKDKKVAENQVTTLSSYLLFNQLLFYHIYQKKTGNGASRKLPELKEIEKVRQLQSHFDAITAIDFKSIFRVNILGHIPDNNLVIETLNRVIQAIRLLKAELITHDLAGRFFHDLIPFEVRKILAAYYTHPNSADLLAGLTIRSWDDSVIDPACGSGTLLVASYNTKFGLYKQGRGYENVKQVHRQFLENDITGSDIMPFASHLTTINLAMQDIDQHTNIVRIASMDSLELAPKLRSLAFTRGKGIEITGFEKVMQLTLDNKPAWSKKGGSVSMEGRGTKFYLKPTDVVIMNPPFSDRERMPAEMREKLNENETLNNIVGSHVNLWGAFIGLADLLLKNGGRIGAVIPINVARGKATQQLRDFLLGNYTCEFMVNALEDAAFSEGASFRDVLYIARKKKANKDDYTAIVSLKVSIKHLKSEEIQRLVAELGECYSSKIERQTGAWEIRFVRTLDLLKDSQNLMPLIGMKSGQNQKIISGFLNSVRTKAGERLVKIDKKIIKEGFHASPSGLSELVFITNPTDKSRIEKAFLILKDRKRDSLQVEIKNSGIDLSIPISKVMPALRTLTAVKTFNVQDMDYVLFQEPDKFGKILQLSKWKGSFDWFAHSKNVREKSSYVVTGRRFRPNSPNTHHFAFFSKTKVLSPDTFKILAFESMEEALLQTLILNSSITMASMIMLREQTTGGLTDIRETELLSFDIFNMRKLSADQTKKLYDLFDGISKSEFPSIKEQFATANELRRLLDSTILEVLGFDKREIPNLLDGLYKAIFDELNRKD